MRRGYAPGAGCATVTAIRSSRPSTVASWASPLARRRGARASRASRRRRSSSCSRTTSSSSASPPSVSSIRSSTARPALLARVLHGVDDLAREALAAQLVVEVQVERDGVRALALELVALERLHRELEVVGAERVVLAVDDDDADRARRSRSAPATCAGSSAATRRRDLRHPLAEARAERAVVRLHLVGAELVGLLDEAQRLDVELVAHDVGEALDRLALARRRRRSTASRSGWRTLTLAWPRAARPRRDGLARGAIADLEPEVARRASGAGQSVRCTDALASPSRFS